jgi:hypothetical protein
MGDTEADGNVGGELEQQSQSTDYEENSLSDEYEKNRADVESYRPFANAMLAISTFAGTITLTVLLTPGNGTHVPGLTLLAYSSSIFIGSIMGCICMISSIALNMPFGFVRMEATILGLMLFSAFYLLLLTSSLFLNHQGPFILGSILYLGFGVLLGILSLLDCLELPGVKQVFRDLERLRQALRGQGKRALRGNVRA